MFCPKCGTQNPDEGKFCRSCGTDLGNVSAALSNPGNTHANFMEAGAGGKPARDENDPAEIYGDAIKQIITGIGFLVAAVVLFTTGVAGGKAWWWAMLFPAFGCLGTGISGYLKSKRLEQRQMQFVPEPQKAVNQAPPKAELPPNKTEYVAPNDRGYQTGDLVPPSVVENTTRHLEMNSEGETMTLPKKKTADK